MYVYILRMRELVLHTQGYTYINYMLLGVPNTEAALPCCSAMDTLEKEWEGLVIMCHVLLTSADICEQTESIRAKGT